MSRPPAAGDRKWLPGVERERSRCLAEGIGRPGFGAAGVLVDSRAWSHLGGLPGQPGRRKVGCSTLAVATFAVVLAYLPSWDKWSAVVSSLHVSGSGHRGQRVLSASGGDGRRASHRDRVRLRGSPGLRLVTRRRSERGHGRRRHRPCPPSSSPGLPVDGSRAVRSVSSERSTGALRRLEDLYEPDRMVGGGRCGHGPAGPLGLLDRPQRPKDNGRHARSRRPSASSWQRVDGRSGPTDWPTSAPLARRWRNGRVRKMAYRTQRRCARQEGNTGPSCPRAVVMTARKQHAKHGRKRATSPFPPGAFPAGNPGSARLSLDGLAGEAALSPGNQDFPSQVGRLVAEIHHAG